MKKLVDWVRKIFNYTNIICLSSCIVYAIVCVFCFIYTDIGVWVLLGAVVINIILMGVMYVVYDKRIKKFMEVGDDFKKLSDGLKAYKEGDSFEVQSDTQIEEISEIKGNIDSIVKMYNDKLQYTVFIDYKVLDFDEDPVLHIAKKESFESQLPTVLKETSYANSLFMLVKLCGGNNPTYLKDLIQKIKIAFPKSLLAVYDDMTISVLVLNVAGKIEVEGGIEYLVGSFAKSDVLEYEDRVDTYFCRVGAVIYPNTLSDDVLSCAKAALDKEENVSFYEGEEIHNVVTHNEDRKAFTSNFIRYITDKVSELKSLDEKLDFIKSTLLDSANAFGYNHSSLFLLNEFDDSMECYFDKYTSKLGRLFRSDFLKEKREFSAMGEVFDAQGNSYFSSTMDLPPQVKELYEIYGVKSGFQTLVKAEGKILGVISIESDESENLLAADDLYALELVFHMLSSLIATYYAQINDKRQNMLIDSLVNKSSQYLYMVDKTDYKLTYVSQSLLAKRPNAKVGQCCYEVIAGLKKPCSKCPLKEATVDYVNESLGEDLTGSVLSYLTSASIEAAVLVQSKANMISEKATVVEQYDSILNIKNVNALNRDLDEILKQKEMGYIALLDIDGYQKQLEIMSQDDMNNALTILVNTLQANGYKDSIYRWSDSSFVFILRKAKRPEALAHIEKIFELAYAPIRTNDYDVQFNYHCAIAMYPSDFRDVLKLERVVNTCRDESIALGMNCTYIYGEKGGRQSERKKYVLDVIDEAIAKDKFEIYIQPIVSLADGKTPVYGEVLLRLRDSQRMFIQPNEFIPIANANGRMFGLEMSILNQVGELWKSYGFTIFHQVGVERISVNISSSTITNPEFVNKVIGICKKYKFAKGFLQFEINERMIKENIDTIADHIRDLAEYGISWSVDNYGTAGTDLSEIMNVGFNQVKVDRSYILDIDTNDRNKFSVSFITSSATKGGLTVVAEGVETNEQLDICKSIGFTSAQGYYFLKPVAVNDYIKYLNFGK